MSRMLILKVDRTTKVIYCYCRVALKMRRIIVDEVDEELLKDGFFLRFDGEGEVDEETGIIHLPTVHVQKPEISDFISWNGTGNPRIRAWIGFSSQPGHITHDKKTAWADLYGLLDSSDFCEYFLRCPVNTVHSVELAIKPDILSNQESWSQPFFIRKTRRVVDSQGKQDEVDEFMARLEEFEEQERRKKGLPPLFVPIVEEDVFEDAVDEDSEYVSAASDLPGEPLQTLSLSAPEQMRSPSSDTARLGQSSETAASSPLVSPTSSIPPPPGIPAHMWDPSLRPVSIENPPQSAPSTTSSSLPSPQVSSVPQKEKDFPVEIRTIDTTPPKHSAFTSDSHQARRPSLQSTLYETPRNRQESRCVSRKDSPCWSTSDECSEAGSSKQFEFDNKKFAELRSRFQSSTDNTHRENQRQGSSTSQTSRFRQETQRRLGATQSPPRRQVDGHGSVRSHSSRKGSPQSTRSTQQARQHEEQFRCDPSRYEVNPSRYQSRAQEYFNNDEHRQYDNRQDRRPDTRMSLRPLNNDQQYSSESDRQYNRRHDRHDRHEPMDSIEQQSSTRQECSSSQSASRDEYQSRIHREVEAVALIHESTRIIAWLPTYRHVAAIWRRSSGFRSIRLGMAFLCDMHYIPETDGIHCQISCVTSFINNARYNFGQVIFGPNDTRSLSLSHKVDFLSEIEDFRAWNEKQWPPMMNTEDGVTVVIGDSVSGPQGQTWTAWQTLYQYRGNPNSRWVFSKCHLKYREIPLEVVERQYRGIEVVQRYVWVLHEIEELQLVNTWEHDRMRRQY